LIVLFEGTVNKSDEDYWRHHSHDNDGDDNDDKSATYQ